MSKLKEPVITLTLENVTPEEWDQSTSSRPYTKVCVWKF